MLGQLVLILQIFLCTLLEGSNIEQKILDELPLAKPYQDTWFRVKSSIAKVSNSSQEISHENEQSKPAPAPTGKPGNDTKTTNFKTLTLHFSKEFPENLNNSQTNSVEITQVHQNLKIIPNSTTFHNFELEPVKTGPLISNNNLNLSNSSEILQNFDKESADTELKSSRRKGRNYNFGEIDNKNDNLFQYQWVYNGHNYSGLGPNGPNDIGPSTDHYGMSSTNIYNPLYEPLTSTSTEFPLENQEDFYENTQISAPPLRYTTQITPTISLIEDLLALSSELISLAQGITKKSSSSSGSLSENEEFELAKKKLQTLQRTFNLGNMMKGIQTQIKNMMAMLGKIGGGIKNMINTMCQIGNRMITDMMNFARFMLNMVGLGSGKNMITMANDDWLIPLYDLSPKDNATAGGYVAVTQQPFEVDGGNKGETGGEAAADGGNDILAQKAAVLAQKAAAKAAALEKKKAIKAQKANAGQSQKQGASEGGWEEEASGQWTQDSQSIEKNQNADPNGDVNEWMDIMSSTNLATSSELNSSVKKPKKKKRKKKIPKKPVKKPKNPTAIKKPNTSQSSKSVENHSKPVPVKMKKKYQNYKVSSSVEKIIGSGSRPIRPKKKKKGNKKNRPTLSWDYYTFKK